MEDADSVKQADLLSTADACEALQDALPEHLHGPEEQRGVEMKSLKLSIMLLCHTLQIAQVPRATSIF